MFHKWLLALNSYHAKFHTNQTFLSQKINRNTDWVKNLQEKTVINFAISQFCCIKFSNTRIVNTMLDISQQIPALVL
jgi:hypothetical protein